MVERLRDPYGIKDEKVLNAMLTVPRHFFVSQALQGTAYGDHALPIDFSQTISQPYIVGRMTELLEVDKKSRVLEIGAGSGYQTACWRSLLAGVAMRASRLATPLMPGLRELGLYNALSKLSTDAGWKAHGPSINSGASGLTFVLIPPVSPLQIEAGW